LRRVSCLLPHPLEADGVSMREVHLRVLTGSDEEELSSSIGEDVFTRSESLLRAVLEQRIAGSLSKLSIGDVAILYLTMRRLTFGNVIHLVIPCPYCAEQLSATLKISELLSSFPNETKSEIDCSVEGYSLKLRPANLNDLKLLRTAQDNAPDAISLAKLVRSCVIFSNLELPEILDEEMISEISTKLAEMDPRADILLTINCPLCGEQFQTPFFPEDYFLRELDARSSQFEREVHWLALNYHWSEEAILSLPIQKRKRHVELINRSLSGASL
jgi:hypothetical protein